VGWSGRPWRAVGRIGRKVWDAELGALSSPILAEGDAPYKAAGEHSALCLAQILHESVGGTKGIATTGGFNALGQRPRPGDPIPAQNNYARFDSWAACVSYWYGKITDPAYAYAPTTTLAEYVHVYSPDSDNQPGQEAMYLGRIGRWFEEWGIDPGDDGAGERGRSYGTRNPLTGPVTPRVIAGRVYLPLHQRNWTAVEETPRKAAADPNSADVGPPVRKGQTITLHYVTAGKDGKLWLANTRGTRVLARAFVEK
jgi:hypothetical protein